MSPMGKKKPDFTMIMGLGPKRKPESGPPAFGGEKTGAPGAEVDTPATDPAEELAEGSLTPEMLSYHGGTENCGACSHFTDPATCDRFPDPVEVAGYCKGFESGDTGDQMQAADMGEQGMEQPAA